MSFLHILHTVSSKIIKSQKSVFFSSCKFKCLSLDIWFATTWNLTIEELKNLDYLVTVAPVMQLDLYIRHRVNSEGRGVGGEAMMTAGPEHFQKARQVLWGKLAAGSWAHHGSPHKGGFKDQWDLHNIGQVFFPMLWMIRVCSIILWR